MPFVIQGVVHDILLFMYSVIRTCYFTSNSTMRKPDFMKMINSSFPSGGLTCGFQDNQLSEFIQIKKREKKIPVKRAVSIVGPQQDDLWVLGRDLYINSDGQMVTSEESDYVWISDLYDGPGVADVESSCNVRLPLDQSPLQPLLRQLEVTMKHNFFPSLLMVGACAMALHYVSIKKELGFCPVPIAYGNPGTGKTTSLKCGLSMLGLLPKRLWSNATKEMFSTLFSTGYMPLGIDDPKSKSMISDLVMSLYGGANEGCLSRGAHNPTSTAVISANFAVNESEK